MGETAALNIPIIDLSSPDRISTANSIRQACVEYGFFYLVNHGVDEDFMNKVFQESAKFFSLPIQHKINLKRKDHGGYIPFYAQKYDPKGDSKESYIIGSLVDTISASLNQWPSEDLLPNWKPTMESLFWKLLSVGNKLLSVIALSLNLDEDYFDKINSLSTPGAFFHLWRYSGELGYSAASPHSDYGMIALLMTNGVPGLQICKDKLKQPQVWEDVPHVKGAIIVNIGDMMERWTNCVYKSTLHRVIPTGNERYSVAFFLDPPSDYVVECFESCCSESNPPKFPPIRRGDYMNEKLKKIYGSEKDLR